MAITEDKRRPGRPERVEDAPLLMTAEAVMRTLVISRRSLYALVSEGVLDIVHPRPRLTRFKTAQVLQLAESGMKADATRLSNLRNRKEIAADAAQ